MTLHAVPAQVDFAKSDDGFFNVRAAQAAHDLIMKMDEEEARLFVTMIVAEETFGLIEKNHRTLQAHLNEVVSKRVERIKKGISATVVYKRMNGEEFDEEEALATAGALSLIEKAVNNPYSGGQQWDENKIRRAGNGRFSVKVKTKTLKKPLSDRNAVAAGIAEPTGKGSVPPARRAEYQSQYLQIAAALDHFSDDDDARLLIQHKDGGGVDEVRLGSANARDAVGRWNPRTENVVGINVAPKSLTVGGAGFGLVTALGGAGETAAMAGRHLSAADAAMPGFANDWSAAGNRNTRSSNQRTYDRVAAGSEFLGQVAPRGSKAQLAAKFGEIVGQRGPEAEQVIGPRARKTAYRYRGVSKEPDADVARVYETTLNAGQGKVSDEARTSIKRAQTRALTRAIEDEAVKQGKPTQAIALSPQRRAEVMNQAHLAVVQGGQTHVTDVERTEARLRTSRALEMKQGEKRPNASLYDLQLASGHLPPSEGVLIDRHGKVTAQAIGYADDHYLPFNLKQLGALKGGEYIRTRSVGGPTSEDIYTGFIAGANAITVSSRSGTFEVVFEDDFKGGRRYNDKAKRMIDRYEKLLDAVQSGQVQRAGRDISRQVQDHIRAGVDSDPRTAMLPKDLKAAAVRDQLAAYRADDKWNEIDEEIVQETADRHGDAPEGRDHWERIARETLKRDKETNFQLNANGYEAALHALREQFPYYIKSVRRYPRAGQDEDRGASPRDRGYVKPRHNRPEEARAGYFDSSINGESKMSADQMDYQNHGVRSKMTARPVQREAKEESVSVSPGVKATPVGNIAAAEGRATARQEAKATPEQQKGLADAVAEAYSIADNVADISQDTYPIGTADELREEIAARGTTGPRYEAWNRLMKDASTQLLGDPGEPTDNGLMGATGRRAMDNVRAQRGQMGAINFVSANIMSAPQTPYKFPEYEGLGEPEIQQEMKARDHVSVTEQTDRLSDLASNDDAMREQLDLMVELPSVIADARKVGTPEAWTSILGRNYDPSSETVLLAADQPRAYSQVVEDTHRLRALNIARVNAAPRQRQRQTSSATTPPSSDDDDRVRVTEVPFDRADSTLAMINAALPPQESDAVLAFRDAQFHAQLSGDKTSAKVYGDAALTQQRLDEGAYDEREEGSLRQRINFANGWRK